MTARKKILFIHPNLATGGAETQLVGFLAHLSANHDVHLALFEYSDQEAHRLAHLTSLSVYPLRKNSGIFSTAGALIRLRAIVRVHEITIVKTYLSNTNLLAFLLKLGNPGLTVVWGLRNSTIQRDHDTIKEMLVRQCLLRVSPKIDLLIANNRRGLESFQDLGLRPRTTVVIENGVDTQRYCFSREKQRKARELFGVDRATFVIGIVARQVPWKGHEVALRALKRADMVIPDLKLIIIGDGPDDWVAHLKSQARNLRLEDKILWLGDRDDVDSLLSGFNVFTLAST
ncbi:MAG: glycosyltransferase, partial [Saprospiraceae bacterium]|nr:glycosyltransferase [Saprospiraceae bacterium]